MSEINFDMQNESPESFLAGDVNPAKWGKEDFIEASEAREFVGMLKETYPESERKNLEAMLATVVDDAGNVLGNSRLFTRAVAKAARQSVALFQKREGDVQDGQPRLKYHMPVSSHERTALQREAQAILDRELMAARAEFIKRSGRSLPGWWR